MRPDRFYPGHWEFLQDGEAKCFSFEKESSVRIEIFVSSVSSSTESPALKIEPVKCSVHLLNECFNKNHCVPFPCPELSNSQVVDFRRPEFNFVSAIY